MPSFKDALAEYRRLAEGWLTPEDRSHLKRWEADDRAEDIWKACEEWPDLISIVCGFRIVANAMADLVPLRIEWQANMEELRKALSKFLVVHSDLSDPIVPPSITFVANLIKNLQESMAHVDEILTLCRNLSGMKITRQDSDGTRRRNLFVGMLSQRMHLKFGRWHDNEVAILTDITFPAEDAISLDAVRSARRPTTRKARKRNIAFPATAGK